jgi:hypothetical protein
MTILLLPSLALAGDLHTSEYRATVSSVAAVERFSFEDRLDIDAETPPLRTGGPACAITVAVEHPFFDKPETLYASVPACERVVPGEAVSVQYLGLASLYQFIAIRVRGEWASLPMMRATGTKNEAMVACTKGERQCSPIEAPPL